MQGIRRDEIQIIQLEECPSSQLRMPLIGDKDTQVRGNCGLISQVGALEVVFNVLWKNWLETHNSKQISCLADTEIKDDIILKL